MANNRISRSYNASPLPTSDEFLSFLQPSPRPDTSILNTFSTRAHSPRFTSKESKSKKVSPLPVSHNIKARLELTQKSNAMLVERNKVLAKEKGLLQKKLSKGKNDPREVFKEQLVNFTKESYFNKRNKETNGGIKEIGEKVTEIRKILNWAFEQSDDTMVRFVKPGLAEAISKIKGFEIDVEAYKAYCLSESEGKIRVLELRANSQTAESQAAVNILIGKNSELSKTIHNLELRIEEQHVKYI